jgi:cytochrome P450
MTETHAGRTVTPPAPWPSQELNSCPFPFYAELRHDAPVYRDPVRGDYLVSRFDDINFVLRHPDVFVNDIDGDTRAEAAAAGCPMGEVPEGKIVTTTHMTKTDPPEHFQKRLVARRMISKERLRSYEPIIEGLVHSQIDAFVGRGEVEFCSEFANPTAFRLICRILGFTLDDAEVFWTRGNPGTNHGARYLSAEELEAMQTRVPSTENFMRQKIVERAENPGEDFISEFVQVHMERAGGELQLDYLVTEADLLLHAGNETTARLLGNTMKLLLDNPEQMEAVVADRSLVPLLIEESLRIEAPTQWVTRRCTADTEVGGVPIPAGALVVVLYASGNRDETKWGDDAEVFRIDRPDTVKYQQAFGGGAHLCLGAPIARLEGRMAMEIVLDRLRNIRYAPGKNDFANIENIQKRAPKQLFLEFDPA